ncbi:MAG: DUF1015 family protein [Bacteroidetes bacterium]|nr:DUF1015 family protein [Bacteroidota bacterium]
MPFRACIPDKYWVEAVTSHSSDFHSDEEIIQEMQSNPRTYMRVTKMPLLFPGKYQERTEFLPDSREFVRDLIDTGVLVPDLSESFYICRQTIDGVPHTGVIGLCDIEDYQNDHIRRHEFTRHDREEFISSLIRETGVIGEPVLLSHHHRQSLEDLIFFLTGAEPDLSFSKGTNQYEVWKISDPNHLQNLQHEFREISDFYIMDGHHRIASVANLYEQNSVLQNRYALSFVLDANQLNIGPFHRYLHSTGIQAKDILNKLEEDFSVQKVEDYVFHPSQHRSMILKCVEGTFVVKPLTSWGGLDVDLLEQKILLKLFGVNDSRSDERLDFIEGDSQLRDVWPQLKSDGNFLFLMFPCTFSEIAMTSDAHKVMPPKSTFVEPKCRAGLFVQPFGDKAIL